MTLASEANDRRLIGGVSDVVKLMPLKYKWAWDYYNIGNANHWLPQEVNMQKDIEQWNAAGVLTDNEKAVVKTALGFFATADSLVSNNLVLGVYAGVTAPEVRLFLLRQAYEEAVHVHCLTDAAEILTSEGFKPFTALAKENKVAQYHPDGHIDFVNPLDIIHSPYKGDMIQFKNGGSYVQTVTPKHRCVTLNERKGNLLEIHLAEDLIPCNRRFPVSGELRDGQGITDSDRLQIAYQADGSLLNKGFDNGAITGKIGYVFGFKKERKIQRMQALLDRMGCDYTRTVLSTGHTKFYVRIPKETPLLKEFTWVSLDNISKQWCEEFIEELAHWDGTPRPLGVEYSTSNPYNKEVVKTLAHLCGKRAGEYVMPAHDNRAEHYQIHISNKPYVSGKVISKKLIHYEGDIHCVTVPSGMIVVKEGGNIFITGNSYQHIIETLGLDEEEIFSKYRHVEAIYNKDNFVCQLANMSDLRPQAFLEALIDFYIIMEGIFFYCSFAAMFSFKRRNLLPGTVEQFQYIARDELQHLRFGTELINGIIAENPELWTTEFKNKIVNKIKQAIDLEYEYATILLGTGILGLTKESFYDYTRFIANLRLEGIGLPAPYAVKNPFPWMSEITELRKQKNFFETRVTDYQSGGSLEWV